MISHAHQDLNAPNSQVSTSGKRIPDFSIPSGPLATLTPREKPAMPDLTITPPDSIRLTVKLDGGDQPISLSAIPGSLTSAIQRDDATHLAVSLNRKILAGDRYFQFWHVVAFCRGGFCVVRLLRPDGWNPQTEYATPPSANCGLMNMEVRIEVNRFNQMQLKLPSVNHWQIIIKPLEYPKVANCKELTEKEADVVLAVVESLGIPLNVQRMRNSELRLQIPEKGAGMLNRLGWNTDRGSAKSLAQQLHLMASRFQTAGELVDAFCRQDPTL
ncbi:hypothetical protein SH668x_001035 [Planctomicrobium sp. SH668]|uniref:hypothetical protein n=1 Tax=Planctomicrobium sp. SH668 TaxID=3448126 RepID=UPI003F5B8F41